MFRELIGDFKPDLLRRDDVQAALAGLNVTYPSRRSVAQSSMPPPSSQVPNDAQVIGEMQAPVTN